MSVFLGKGVSNFQFRQDQGEKKVKEKGEETKK